MRQADRIIINVISNYGLTVLGMVANLLMVPIVINRLGRSGFGLATMILAAYGVFELLANSVGRALERYVPQALAEHDDARLNRTFNAARVAFFLMGLVGAVSVFALQGWLTGDAATADKFGPDALWACWLLAAYMVAGYPWLCYQRTLGAMQRYDLVGVYIGTTSLVRMILVTLVFWWGRGSISFFIGSMLLAIWLAAFLCRRALRRLTPQLSPSIRHVDRATGWMVGTFAAGTLFIVVGNILVNQGFTFFVGKRLGLHELGGLAAVLTIRTLLWTLINNVAGVLTPAVSSLEARGSEHNITKLFLSGTKYSSMMAVMICGVPIMVAAPFLELWLGAAFKGLDMLLYLLLLAQIPLSPALTSQQVLLGLGRVRRTGQIVFVRGVLAIAAALAYAQWIAPSLNGTAACVFGIQLVGGVVLFLYAATATQVSWSRALWDVLGRPIALGTVGAVATWIVVTRLGPPTWWTLLTATGVGELVFLALALTLGFTAEEKSRLHSFAGRVKNRFLPPVQRTISATEGEP